jgi:hypothetical protein
MLACKVNGHMMKASGLTKTDKQGLVEELEQIRSKDADKDGKRKIVPKDEVKKNIARSRQRRLFHCAHILRASEASRFVPAPTTGLVKNYPGHLRSRLRYSDWPCQELSGGA